MELVPVAAGGSQIATRWVANLEAQRASGPSPERPQIDATAPIHKMGIKWETGLVSILLRNLLTPTVI